MNEETVAFHWNDIELVGTLHLPYSSPPPPVVVMIQGSGPSDRTGNDYFPPIRDAFLAAGVATYAFDKPGCGDSSGDWRDYGLRARADQVEAAMDRLRNHTSLQSGTVGLWGQSQGGWLVQMLAAQLPNLAFAIANSGPSIDTQGQDLYGCEHSMRANGYTEAHIQLALSFMVDLHSAAKDGLSYEEVEDQLLASARSQPWYSYMTIENETDWRLVTRFTTEKYTPTEAIRHIRCPFLAVYGGRDVLLPAWQSARETGHALQQAGNKDSVVVVFPEGNHRIMHTNGGFISGYLSLLTDWTARHVK